MTDPMPHVRRAITAGALQARPSELPKDWNRLDDVGRHERLFNMVGSGSFLRFVRAMIATGTLDLNRVNPDPQGLALTPLLQALTGPSGWPNAHALLQAGANPRVFDANGMGVWYRLFAHTALIQKDLDAFQALTRALIRAGADVNQTGGPAPREEGSGHDRTPLHLAYMGRHYEVVDLLLEAGADPRKVTATGRSLLHELLYFHDRTAPETALQELIRLVDGYGLDVNALSFTGVRAGDAGLTPLDIAPALDPVAIALIERGGRFNRSTSMGTVIHQTLTEGRVAALKALVPLGMTEPWALDGHPPLQSLVEGKGFDQREAMELFLATYPATDLHRRDSQGHTLLHVAAYHGRTAVMQRLLDLGLPVNVQDLNGETPLVELCKGPAFNADAAGVLFSAGLSPYDADTLDQAGQKAGTVAEQQLMAAYVDWERKHLREVSRNDGDGLEARDRPRRRL